MCTPAMSAELIIAGDSNHSGEPIARRAHIRLDGKELETKGEYEAMQAAVDMHNQDQDQKHVANKDVKGKAIKGMSRLPGGGVGFLPKNRHRSRVNEATIIVKEEGGPDASPE